MDMKSVRLFSLLLLVSLVAGTLTLLAGRFLPEDQFMLAVERGGIRYYTPERPFAYSWYLSVACRPEYLDRIYVLTDPRVDNVYIGNRAVLDGLLHHLASDAAAIGWEPAIETVTIEGMREVLESGQPAVIVDPLGYWPADISVSSLRTWLEAGGVFIWLGDRLGYWLWTTGGPAQAERTLDQLLWGRSIYDEAAPHSTASRPLPPEQNLGLAYRWAIWGPSPAAIADLGGRALGWQTPDGRRVSHAVVPLGQGAVVLFGSRLVRLNGLESDVAQDIVAMLYRGLTDTGVVVRAGVSSGSAVSGFEEVVPTCIDAQAVIGSSDRWMFHLVRARLGPSVQAWGVEGDRGRR